MKSGDSSVTDLRKVIERRLGKPLAASAKAALWRCPVCRKSSHSLLMVSADQYRCLGRCQCDGGVSEWMQNLKTPTSDAVAAGEIV